MSDRLVYVLYLNSDQGYEVAIKDGVLMCRPDTIWVSQRDVLRILAGAPTYIPSNEVEVCSILTVCHWRSAVAIFRSFVVCICQSFKKRQHG